jgi:hypothetical protein
MFNSSSVLNGRILRILLPPCPLSLWALWLNLRTPRTHLRSYSRSSLVFHGEQELCVAVSLFQPALKQIHGVHRG